METKFNDLLAQCEHMSLLINAGAIPKSINGYGFGWFAKRIYPILTDKEKAEKFWELSIDYIEESMKQADILEKMTREERLNHLKLNHFV